MRQSCGLPLALQQGARNWERRSGLSRISRGNGNLYLKNIPCLRAPSSPPPVGSWRREEAGPPAACSFASTWKDLLKMPWDLGELRQDMCLTSTGSCLCVWGRCVLPGCSARKGPPPTLGQPPTCGSRGGCLGRCRWGAGRWQGCPWAQGCRARLCASQS